MKTRPFVSVIIPVYNDPHRLRTCLQILEKQTYPKTAYEVVVIDNGSDDSIEPIVAEFKQARAGYESVPGAYAARNKALDLAAAEVLAFTDSDCRPAEDWLERGVTRLLREPHCGVVGGKIDFSFRNSEHPTVPELYDSVYYLNQQLYIEKFQYAVTANLFTYKQVFELVGRFDGSMETSEDKDWGMRVARAGYRLVYAEEARVTHPARQDYDRLRTKVARAARGSATVKKKHRISLLRQIGQDLLFGSIPPVCKINHLRRTYGISGREQGEFLLLWLRLRGVKMREICRVLLER